MKTVIYYLSATGNSLYTARFLQASLENAELRSIPEVLAVSGFDVEADPFWQRRCTECLGCLHICPVEAIDYGGKTKGRKRYRHKDIAPKDLLHRFQEKTKATAKTDA